MGFDGLRGVASVCVLIYHLNFFAPISVGWLHPLLQQLRLGVWIFFALSGFLLYRGFAAAHLDGAEAPRLRNYFRNRVVRILPAYWVALIFFTANHNTLLSPSVGIAGVIRQFSLTQIYSRRDVLLAFGLPRGLPHAWSLAVEISFYLALPLYAWGVGALGRRIGAWRAELGGIAGLMIVWLLWTTQTNGNALRQQWLPNFTMAFGVGITLAVLATQCGRGTKVGKNTEVLARHATALWLGAGGLIVIRSRLTIAHENGLRSQLLYGAIALLLVLPFAIRRGEDRAHPVVRMLDSGPARFIGNISYGIFLWHYLLIRIVRDQWLHGADGHVGFVRLTAVVVPFVVLAAAASWYLIERPLLLEARRASMRFWVSLTAVTVGSLAWRVFYVLSMIGRDPHPKGDSYYYHQQAKALAKGLGFLDPVQWSRTGVITPSASHPPAFSLFLAAMNKLGVTTWTGQRLACAVLGAIAVMVLGLAARELAGDHVGLIAAVLAGGYANLFINDEMQMPESLAAVAIAMLLLVTLRTWKRPSLRSSLQLGAAIGLASMTRAELLGLAVLFVIPMVIFSGDGGWRGRLQRAAAAIGVIVLCIGPWVGFNLSRFHKPVIMSTGVGDVTMYGNCDATYSGQFLGYWYFGCGAKYGASTEGDESDREAKWRKVGTDYISAHLSQFPKVALARAGRMWDVFRPSQNTSFDGNLEGRGFGASQLSFAQYMVLLPLSGVGLVLLRRRRLPIWPFLAIAALVTFTAITAFGITRYRIPVDVFLPVTAAIPLAAAWKWLLQHRRFQSVAAGS